MRTKGGRNFAFLVYLSIFPRQSSLYAAMCHTRIQHSVVDLNYDMYIYTCVSTTWYQAVEGTPFAWMSSVCGIVRYQKADVAPAACIWNRTAYRNQTVSCTNEVCRKLRAQSPPAGNVKRYKESSRRVNWNDHRAYFGVFRNQKFWTGCITLRPLTSTYGCR